MKIIITSPSLDVKHNVSGISSITRFIIESNQDHRYVHFELGKRDTQKRNAFRVFRILGSLFNWICLLIVDRPDLIHFNLAIDRNAVLRDSPFILFAKLFRKRLIIHVHGGEYLSGKEVPRWMKCLLAWVFKGDNPKIVLSVMEELFLQEHYRLG